MIDRSRITNPILRLKDNLRDPSVFMGPDGYTLFYTRYEVGEWNLACNWSVACCTTRDFVTFTNPCRDSSAGTEIDVIRVRSDYQNPHFDRL